MSKSENKSEVDLAKEQPKASTLPHDQETVVEIDPVTTTDHRPGSALETKEDREANEARRAEPVNDSLPEAPPLNVDAVSPVANLASRNNIVADGPGTVADFLVVEDPELLPVTDPRHPEHPGRKAKRRS